MFEPPPKSTLDSERSSGQVRRGRTSEEDDRALLLRVQARDAAAMAELWDRYSGMAYSVAMRVLHDKPQAEDVTQDVFFRVWREPRAFAAERGALAAWLAVMVRNRSIDVIRRRRPSDSVDEVILTSRTDVASEVELQAMIARVRGLLGTMPAEQRESVELAFFSGLTHAEIAEQRGEPLGTVKTRIRMALTALRKAFR